MNLIQLKSIKNNKKHYSTELVISLKWKRIKLHYAVRWFALIYSG